MLKKLYANSSVTTTIIYQSNLMQDEVDDTLDKVVDFKEIGLEKRANSINYTLFWNLSCVISLH